MALVNQPTAAPSRKWWAGLIAGVLVNAAYGAADYLWPGHPFEPYKGEAIGWAVLAVTLVTQYFSRNRANAPVDKTAGMEELDIGSGGGAATPVIRVDEEKTRASGTRKPASPRQRKKAE